LDGTLLEQGIEMIAPHRKNRQKEKKTQDGRKKLRRYKRRWKIERLFAWLQNFRRLVVGYEYKDENFLGLKARPSTAVTIGYKARAQTTKEARNARAS
jgi:transposase